MDNNATIQLLSQFGNQEEKALMLRLPEAMTNGIVISQDGTVNTKDLIEVLKMLYKEEKASKEVDHPVDIMKLIYGPAVARKMY